MIDKKTADFSKFGTSFQENLIRLLILDRPFCNQMMEIININFLEFDFLKHITKSLFEYKDKYKIHPSLEITNTISTSNMKHLDEEIKQQVKEFLKTIKINSVITDAEYIKATTVDFCRTQKVKEAMLESLAFLEDANFDKVYSLFDSAFKLGLDQSYGHDYLEDFVARYEHDMRTAVECGWPIINDETQGGWGIGELAVFIAPTGYGKSMRLVHSAAHALKQGKTVAFYTLELKDTTIGKRFDSCLTGIPINDLWENREYIKKMVEDIPGKLIIKEFPMKSASPKTIENHLEKLILRDIRPDLVVVDYGDLLRPSHTTRDSNSVTDAKAIYEELRSLMQRFQMAGLTASQSNRSGLNVDILTLDYISDAFAKCMIADYIATFSSKGKVFVAKNRNGTSGMIYSEIADFSRVKTEITEYVEEEDIEDEINNSARELMERRPDLSEKIKKFIKAKKG